MATESRKTTARRDAEASENPGVLLDYLTRFPTADREDIVDRRTRYDVSHIRTDWEHAIAPLRTEADFLGYQICNACDPQEIGTYRLLERSFATTQRNAERLRKKLVEWRSEVAFLAIAMIFLLISVLLIGENSGAPVSTFAFAHPYVLTIILAFAWVYYWSVRAYLRSDAATCKELHGKLSRHLIELKVAFLSRDAARLGKANRQLYQANNKLHQIGCKTRRDYFRLVEWREQQT